MKSFNLFLVLLLISSCATSGKMYDWSGLTFNSKQLYSSKPPKALSKRPKDIFREVYLRLDPEIRVFPTENYYYFDLELEGETVHGVFYTPIDKPEAPVFGYFVGYKTFIKKNRSVGFVPEISENVALKDEPSCRISPLMKGNETLTQSWNCFGKEIKVHYNLENIHFAQDEEVFRKTGQIKNNEEYWGTLADDSGHRFLFIYNKVLKETYYVLHPFSLLLEGFITTPVPLVTQGRKSNFIFADVDGRKILIGVLEANEIENNHYDGPADQLPHGDMYMGYIPKIGTVLHRIGSQKETKVLNDYGAIKSPDGTFTGRVILISYRAYNHIEEFESLSRCYKKESDLRCWFRND